MSKVDQKTILLVEDQVLIAIAEAKRLEDFGYDIVLAHSGEDAVSVVEENKNINLILMDIDLGKGISGPEAAEKILSFSNLPIVFLTSHSEMEYVDKVKQITRYGYILKNSGDFVLKSSIEMAFELFQSNMNTIEKSNALNQIFNLTSDLVCIADINTATFVRINPAFESLLGYSKQDLLGQSFLNFVHPDDLQSTVQILEESLQIGKEVTSFINRYRCKDGSYIFLDWNSHPVIEEGFTYATAHNITDQINFEKVLKEAKDLNDAILKASPDEIYVYDFNSGSAIYSNGRMQKVIGMTIDQAREKIKEKNTDIIHPDDIAKHESINKRKYIDLKTGQSMEYNIRFKDKDNNWISINFLESVFARDANNDVTQILGIAQDVTQIQNAQKALSKNELFIRTVMDNLPIGVAVNSVNRQVDFEYVNDNFIKFYRIKREDLNEPDVFWDKVYEEPDFREKIKKRVLDDCATGDPAQMIWKDVPITRKGKETKYVTAMNIPIPEKDLVISTVMDETDRKNVENKIQGLLEEKDILLKEVHHRIKNNIFTIKSLLNLQLRNLNDDSATSAIKDAISRFDSMELLYNKLYQTEHYKEINLKIFLGDLTDLILNSFTHNTNIKIEKDIDDFNIDADYLLPLGIITNEILTNAFKYAFHYNQEGCINVTCKSKDNRVFLNISDDGIGFDNNQVSDRHGFGLSLIQILIKQIGGKYTVNTEHGTEYNIEFSLS